MSPLTQPPLFAYSDLPVAIAADWSVSSVRSAVVDHDNGVFQYAALLADTLRGDDRIAACLASRINSVIGTPFRVEDSKSHPDSAASSRLFEQWPSICSRETLSQLLFSVIWMGFAIGELVWEPSEEAWVPRVKVWSPQYVYFDWSQRQYAVLTGEGIVYVDPQATWDKFFVISPHGAYRGWLGGAVRGLGEVWLRRRFALRDWSRLVEVFGMPFRKAIVPGSASQSDKRKFFSDVVNLSTETVIECPTGINPDSPGYDVEMALAQGTDAGATVIRELIENCDRAIAIQLLGQNLTTEAGSGSGGTYGSATVHQDSFARLIEADVRFLSEQLRICVVEPWAYYNLGRISAAPRPTWDPTPADESEQKSRVIASVGTAISQMSAVGYEFDLAKLSKALGLPAIHKIPQTQRPDPPPTSAASAGVVAARAPMASPSTDAQRRVDVLVSTGARAAQRALAPTLDAALAAIRGATSLQDVRARIVAVAGDLDPTPIADELESGLVSAHVAGRASAREE